MQTATRIEWFVEQVNDAFARGDMAFIADHVTDDVTWSMMGEPVIEGRDALRRTMRRMGDGPLPTIRVTDMIINGLSVFAEGTMTLADESGTARTYGFCDVYRLTDEDEPRIREMTSYVVETGR